MRIRVEGTAFLIDLLDGTFDSLAATADLMDVGETQAVVKPTIQ
jgi:hypothetical protein